MSSAGRLAGKRAVVTGAASGIGRAVALRFAAEGAGVALVDVLGPAIAALASDIHGRGGEAIAIPADVGDEDQVDTAFESASEAFGGVDTVVVNAAIELFGQDARVHELEVSVWDRTMAVNLRGAFLTARAGLRALLASGGGSIVCTGSPTGLFGTAPDHAAYSSSKAGIFGLARAIAIGYASEGIRCNVVVPGFTDTPLVAPLTRDPVRLAGAIARLPLGRAAKPDEIASMMTFLASDEAEFATGAIFTMDGGYTAR